MSDLIKREDAIEVLMETIAPPSVTLDTLVMRIDALPSAEAEPTVIRSRTLLPTKDFKEWAKRIREENPNAVVIPCDAEVVSAEAVHIHNDGTLEVKVPNAKDVGRVLVLDANSHIGGGLYYPEQDDDRPKGDLISRQWLLEVYGDYIGDNGEPKYHVPLEVVRQNIKDALSAEAVQGEWIDRSDGGRVKYPWWESCECNQCGEYGSGAYNYCPNCGARMKGAEHEVD